MIKDIFNDKCAVKVMNLYPISSVLKTVDNISTSGILQTGIINFWFFWGGGGGVVSLYVFTVIL